MLLDCKILQYNATRRIFKKIKQYKLFKINKLSYFAEGAPIK